MADIKLINLVKNFGDVTAVNNINLEVDDKEFLVLVGPSGCGKSTCLRMIAGLDEPSDGQIYIDGQDVDHLPPKDRDIAMVFQNYALYPHMNVYKNMSFGLRLKKLTKAQIEQRVTETARILGIEDLLDRKPKELSGGQRQRVAIGRAIVRKPVAFLFDEPLSNLDAKLRVQMRGELATLHQRLETTSVYVTHDQVEAMTLADRIVVMHRGNIMQTGAPLEVYKNPANLFVAGFIGSPAMNLLDVRLTEESGRLFLKGDALSLSVPDHLHERFGNIGDSEVVLGIRPEDIYDRSIKGDFAGGEVLKASVEVFEPLGSEVLLRVRCGSNLILASVDPNTQARINDTIELIVDTNLLHLFNKETEAAY